MAEDDEKPEVIEMEVVSDTGEPRWAGGRHPGGPVREGPPVHPVAAVLLIAVDNLWMVPEWTVVSWIVTVPAAFVTVYLSTLLVQRLAKGDPPAQARRTARLLGLLAAVPFSLFGTTAGLVFLTWSGLSRLFGPTLPGRRR